MAKRPAPQKSLIRFLTGDNAGFLEKLHHGLDETNISSFYPSLNLDELLAFCYGSRNIKERNPSIFDGLDKSRLHEVFKKANDEYPPIFTLKGRVPRDLSEIYGKCNPFPRSNFGDRLESVSEKDIDNLFSSLEKTPINYVFDCQYETVKMTNNGDNSNITIMSFQSAYPTSKKNIAEKYVTEVTRVIRENFPRELKQNFGQQLNLFAS